MVDASGSVVRTPVAITMGLSFLALAACKSSETEPFPDGSGGNSASTTTTTWPAAQGTYGVGPTSVAVSTGAGSAGSCDDIGNCSGTDATDGCLECTVIGDATVEGGGDCVEEYVACFGTRADCTQGGNLSCCDFDACRTDCAEDDPTFGVPYWQCVCGTTSANDCMLGAAPPASCVGAHPEGADLTWGADGWITCVLDVCETSCAE